ncbi:DNA-formamidopyrimidine glycosylase family protein [Egicoccus halophilus]|uniref:Formamidopyrimidine-DNA glycosylase n=1 Tax=Egicoccus halophilus TaxID=1670830 RepID=A0A8J3AF76_9ACTN|nr:DNA-formamidopyrimidine glycosylase family protein [Egicoccus halophilus]GGI06458.1 formamidopyrimidine-DNA glycosylase [Egicoccus halophilus]
MLELPEVEVLRKDLEKEVVGKKVKDVVVETDALVTSLHGRAKDFVTALSGRTIEAVRRRGRVLFLDLDDAHTWLLDPGEQGYLHRQAAAETAGADTHLTVDFTVDYALHLTEPGGQVSARTGVVAADQALEAAEVAPDALDPLDDNPTWMEFGRFLHAADQPLKLLLMDPTVIAGIGPVYSDEILWEAGLRHDRQSASLSTQEVRRLYRAMQEVLQAAMKAAGSGLDESDADVSSDDDGEAAEHLHVYGREGLPCHRCRKPIARTRIRKGVHTFHCPQCMI